MTDWPHRGWGPGRGQHKDGALLQSLSGAAPPTRGSSGWGRRCFSIRLPWVTTAPAMSLYWLYSPHTGAKGRCLCRGLCLEHLISTPLSVKGPQQSGHCRAVSEAACRVSRCWVYQLTQRGLSAQQKCSFQHSGSCLQKPSL